MSNNNQHHFFEDVIEKNILLTGRPYTEKQNSIIMPCLMQMNSSYVIETQNAELIEKTGHMLNKHGYKIKVFNFTDLENSMKYNPMYYIKKPSEILELIDLLYKNMSGDLTEDAKFEKLLLQALIGAVHYEFPSDERNLYSIVQLLSMIEIREDDYFENKIDGWFNDLRSIQHELETKDNPTKKEIKRCDCLKSVIHLYGQYNLSEAKIKKSAIVSCTTRFADIYNPELNNILSMEELEFDKLGTEKTALFIINNATNAHLDWLRDLMYNQMINMLYKVSVSEKHDGKLPLNVKFIFEDFGNRKINHMNKMLSIAKKIGVSFLFSIMSKAELISLYKDESDYIANSCDIEIYTGGKDCITEKEISELSSGDISILNISSNECIVTASGSKPETHQKYDITCHPNYKFLSETKGDNNWFDVKNYLKHNKKKARKKLVKKLEPVNKDEDKGPVQLQRYNMEFRYDEENTLIETKRKPPSNSLDDLIGLDSVKNTISEITTLLKKRGKKAVPCLHMTFLGNPGTGKTTVARILAHTFAKAGIINKNLLVETSRGGLVAEYVGHTARRTARTVNNAIGGVLFIDEAYDLIGRSNNCFGQEAIATLVKLMEDKRDEFVCIFAGYTNEMNEMLDSNPGLRDRIQFNIEFPDYNYSELLQIFEKISKDYNYTLSGSAKTYMEDMLYRLCTSKHKNFSNARLVRKIFERTQIKQASRSNSNNITEQDIKDAFADKDIASLLGSKSNIGFHLPACNG